MGLLASSRDGAHLVFHVPESMMEVAEGEEGNNAQVTIGIFSHSIVNDQSSTISKPKLCSGEVQTSPCQGCGVLLETKVKEEEAIGDIKMNFVCHSCYIDCGTRTRLRNHLKRCARRRIYKTQVQVTFHISSNN